MFDLGVKKEHHFSLPVISVGNITVGGTGKTPAVEFLLSFLSEKYKIATLSRGYKRSTKGFAVASESSTYKDIGDEPKQISNKFPEVTVAVCEKRVEGINKLLQNNLNLQAIILDDAFQHRYVKPSLNILLIDYNRPIWNDQVFPLGRMRESKRGAERAHIIIITKCPNYLSKKESSEVLEKLKESENKKVFFATMEPVFNGNADSAVKASNMKRNYIALAGIANPEPFFSSLHAMGYAIAEKMIFPDHHNFAEHELHEIEQQLTDGCSIITTEKDSVRLYELIDSKYHTQIKYIPVKMKILFEQENELKELISVHIEEFYTSTRQAENKTI